MIAGDTDLGCIIIKRKCCYRTHVERHVANRVLILYHCPPRDYHFINIYPSQHVQFSDSSKGIVRIELIVELHLRNFDIATRANFHPLQLLLLFITVNDYCFAD